MRFASGCVMLAVLLIPLGCGSASSSTSSSLTPTTSTSGSGPSSATGSWRGALPGNPGDELQLFLTQSGRQIRGDGAVLRGGDPLPVQVGGSLGDGGLAQLQLSTVDKTQIPYVSSLGVVFTGDMAQGLLHEHQGTQSVTLSRSTLLALGLPSSFQVGSSSQAGQYQVQLDTSGTYAYAGSWSTAGGQALTCIQSFSRGKVSFTPIGQSTWARLALEDPAGVLELGTLWVQIGSGSSLPSLVDTDSTVLTAQGLMHLNN